MGGCRCTYRNCTVKSDGMVHLFHYPVFDKLRCHQWLINAQRYDFLDLKVSQLKNRAVCHYHFRDDNFMNFKRDKLTFVAVPTENGPYCNAPDELSTDPESEITGAFPIALDEIENDHFTPSEKQANFSLKYADFLSSGEVDYYQPVAIKNKIQTKPIHLINKQIKNKNNNNIFSITPQYKEKCTKDECEIDLKNPIHIDNKFNIQIRSDINDLQIRDVNRHSANTQNVNVKDTNVEVKRKPNRIKILSEKKLSIPISLSSKKLQPIKPSSLIGGTRKDICELLGDEEDIKNKIMNMEVIIENPPDCTANIVAVSQPSDSINNHTEHVPVQLQDEENDISFINKPLNKHDEKPIAKSPEKNLRCIEPSVLITPDKSVGKKIISAKRVAAIEEKREFNKKLRDMIEFCLEDENDKAVENKINQQEQSFFFKNNKHLLKIKMDDKEKNKVAKKDLNTDVQTLARIAEEPTNFNQGLASIEARLKRMEESLITKIEQNSQSILELKHSVAKAPEDENSYKKRLYSEISHFLSPEMNSTIYEELFLNKFGKNENPVMAKKTKRRRYR